MEHKAEKLFNKIFDIIVKSIGNTTTYNTDLEEVGKRNLGNKFKGVFAADTIPKKLKKDQCMIVNTDTLQEGGEHWTAVKRDKNHGYIGFDSFGRKMNKLIPELDKIGKITDTDLDKDQLESEKNCGAKCIAWCILADHDIEKALLI